MSTGDNPGSESLTEHPQRCLRCGEWRNVFAPPWWCIDHFVVCLGCRFAMEKRLAWMDRYRMTWMFRFINRGWLSFLFMVAVMLLIAWAGAHSAIASAP